MPLTALALVLLAGLIHAGWNIAAKKAGGDARFAAFSTAIQSVVWAPLGLWLGWQHVPLWGGREWALILTSTVLHVVYYLTLLRGYRQADLTVVYPLARGSGPLISSAVAVWLLGERITAWGAVGVVGVVLGVFLIAGGPRLLRAAMGSLSHLSPSPLPARDTAAQRQRLQSGVLYGLLTGVFIAAYTVVDGYAVKVALISPILLDYVGGAMRLLFTGHTLFRDRPTVARLWRAQWKYAAVVGIVSPVSYVMVLYAMQTAPLSHVAPAREVSMLFAALIGGQLLGERDRGSRIAGAALIAFGVIALGWGT